MIVTQHHDVDPCTFEPVIHEYYLMEAGEIVKCVDTLGATNGLVAGNFYTVARRQEGIMRLSVFNEEGAIREYYRWRFKPVVRVKANKS
jgi:hypothetical protein